jgi:coenzyme F420-reducing hydrogenase delta subunit
MILDELKLGSGRVAMLNVDSSDNSLFKTSARDFIGRIQALGPNPLKNSGKSLHR